MITQLIDNAASKFKEDQQGLTYPNHSYYQLLKKLSGKSLIRTKKVDDGFTMLNLPSNKDLVIVLYDDDKEEKETFKAVAIREQ